MEEVKQVEEVQVTEEAQKPKKEKKKAVTGKVFFKKVTITVKDKDKSLDIQCIRLKGDEKLEMGEEITVRGELRNRAGVLEFGNGCTFIKVAEHKEVDPEVVSALQNLPEGEAYANGFCAMTGVVTDIVKMPNETPQKLTLFIGALTMFVAAVFYLLMADLAFNNTASRLIVSVLLSFGSAILFFLSANFNEKPAIMYLFKALGIALGIGFVVYIHLFQTMDTYYLGKLDEFRKAGVAKAKELAMSEATMIVTLVLSYVSVVAQVANTVLVAVIKED
ncbi:MAG: hypothetical protein J1F68_03995 [Clostridiales bacterium]|nr:hypothetical protein [Clostridiales bacterium]